MQFEFDDIVLKRQVTMRGDPVEEFTIGKPCEVTTLSGSVFFPGCSLLGYAPQITLQTFDLLVELGQADCITGVCCGRILEDEPLQTGSVQGYKDDLAKRLGDAHIIRVVCACPNCLRVLERALEGSGIQVVALSEVLADAGIRITGKPDMPVFAVHDSCSDRATGRYADSVRTLLGNCPLTEMRHNRKTSQCCGSSIRAAGRGDEAPAFALRRAQEAQVAGATQIITACMGCAAFIGGTTGYPAHHYLELLFDRRIDWNTMPAHITARLLLYSLPGTRRAFVTPDA